MRDVFLFALLLVVGVGRPSAAQAVTRPFADLGRSLELGDTVRLTGRESGETSGRLVRISAASIVVAVRAQERETPSTPPGPPAAQAQAVVDTRVPANSLGALSSQVRLGDTVSVRVTSGQDIVGTFSRASEASLTVEVDGQTREIPASDIQQVVRLRGGNRLRRGLWIGAPMGALLGSGSCYRVDSPGSGTGPSCGASVLGGAAIGAGIGALIGSKIWRPALVYSTPPGPPAAPRQAAVDARAPVPSLGALSSRVKPFEKIYVRRASGEEVVGSFSRASEASLTVEVDGQTREIPASDVQQVWRRGGNRVHQGMFFGFLTGAAVADTFVAASEGSKSAGFFVGTVAGGGAGLIWGAIIGAFVHERPVVYRTTAPTVRVMPVLAPGRAGVMVSARF